MTADEWDRSVDEQAMLAYLRDHDSASGRKHRLFAVACCRRVWDLLSDEGFASAVELAERFAEGAASDEERTAAFNATMNDRLCPIGPLERRVNRSVRERRNNVGAIATAVLFGNATQASREVLARISYALAQSPAGDAGAAAQAALLREVVGNPLRPASLDPDWVTANVLDLARTIYELRTFDRMAILADALMDAGCTDEAILGHCRSQGTHARGCWVVDLILGKA